MRRAARRSRLAAAMLAGLAVVPLAADDWPGFRGLHRQGVGVARESPTTWSASRNVAWIAAVPGSGHSSPVVAGDRVFVTTAYEQDGAKRLLAAARFLRAALALAALALWLVLPVRVRPLQEALAAVSMSLFAALALGDERLFELARSPARAWLGAGLSVVIGLFMSLYGLGRASVARRGIALALAATGTMVIVRTTGAADQSRQLALAVLTVAGGAFAASILALRGALQPDAIRVGRPRFRLRWSSRVVPAWRALVLLAAALAFTIIVLLVPRSGVAYAVAGLDRATGRVMWIREGLWGTRTAVHRANSLATPTAVTDGARVFAYFGSAGLMAVKTDGTLLWTSARAPFQTIYGVGASPVLAGTAVIVSAFAADGPYLAAFDAATGAERWRTSRVRVHPEFGDSRTPLVVRIGGRDTVVVWGTDELAGYDLEAGHRLWRYMHGANHRMGSMVVSMLADRETLYLPLENGMIALSLPALAAGRDPQLWTSRGGASGLATPVLYDGRIFAVSAAGIASCVDATTGNLLWRARLEGAYFASPVAMAGKVYFTNESGATTVVTAGSAYDKLAENDIGEPVTATMAAVGGSLFLRSHRHLYAIRP